MGTTAKECDDEETLAASFFFPDQLATAPVKMLHSSPRLPINYVYQFPRSALIPRTQSVSIQIFVGTDERASHQVS
jgi:hypothetical protein